MSRRQNRSRKWMVIVAVLMLAAGFSTLWLPRLFRIDFRQSLARQLNVNPAFLHLNIPPAPGRYPGFSFVVPGPLVQLTVPLEESSLTKGPTFDMDWRMLSKTDAASRFSGGPLQALFSSSVDDVISISLVDCQVFEATAGQLKDGLLKSDEVLRQANLGREPLVIVRSYAGKMSLKIRRASSSTGEGWAEKVKVAKTATGNGQLAVAEADEEHLMLVWSTPVVFAYEALEARIFAEHLGASPDAVEFKPAPETDARPATAPSADRASKRMHWGLCATSSGYYPQMRTLEQPWNQGSARLIVDTLAEWKPQVSEELAATAATPLTPESITQFLTRFGQRARDESCEFIVCYFIGHVVVNKSGQSALIQGGVTSDRLQAGLRSDSWHDAGDAVLPLAGLNAALENVRVPFLLLLDGCMDHPDTLDALAKAGFEVDPKHPGNALYTGPKEILAPSDFEAIIQALRTFGNSESFLKGTNPIIFAAKPGTFARPASHPLLDGGPAVGPLAASIQRCSMFASPTRGVRPSLQDLLRTMDVWRGVGEITMDGFVSWSDFSEFEAMAARLTPEGFVGSDHALKAIAEILKPGLGPIEQFTFDPKTRDWYLEVHTVEPSGRNRWDIWKWQPGAPAVPVAKDVLFPKIAFADGSLYLYTELSEGYPTLTRIDAGPKVPLFARESPIADIRAGWGGQSLLIKEADNTVGLGGDHLHRIRQGLHEVVFTGELTEATDIVELAPGGHFAWIDGESPGTVARTDVHGEITHVHLATEELSGLHRVSDKLVAINREHTRLYRLGDDLRVSAAWLLDDADHPLVDSALDGDGPPFPEGRLWVANEDMILGIDLDNLEWQPISKDGGR